MTESQRGGASGSARASDIEREAVVTRLNGAFSEGRLTMEELSDRVGQAYAARTVADLTPLVADLPETDRAPAAASSARPVRSSSPGHRTQWHVSPIGGMRRRGGWRMPRQLISVTLIGGADLDFGQAQLSAPEMTLTKFSLLGGVDLKVPSNVRVEIEGFSLIGGHDVRTDEAVDPNAPTLIIRAFSLIGGIRVRNT